MERGGGEEVKHQSDMTSFKGWVNSKQYVHVFVVDNGWFIYTLYLMLLPLKSSCSRRCCSTRRRVAVAIKSK